MSEYLKKVKRKGGHSWRLTPPDDLRKAGVAKVRVIKDGRTAIAAAKSLKQKVKDFREGKIVGSKLPKNANLRQLAAHYLHTPHFADLSKNTQEIYQHNIEKICETPVNSTTFGQIKLDKITAVMCAEVFDLWVKQAGPVSVNQRKTVFSVLMNHAINLDMRTHNPMAKVKSVKHEPDVWLWTRQQVEDFVEEAFKDFKYRSIGLVVLLCYEWGQRPVDICHLKWDNLDFSTDTCTIVQKKTKAEVYLPIEGNIKKLLLKQKEDFDFQEYVAPYLRASDSAWRPMTTEVTSRLLREVKSKIGLPDKLHLRGLRSTAITEMVEANVEITQIKQVSGHKSLASLNPYVRNTLKGAKSALDLRRKNNGT